MKNFYSTSVKTTVFITLGVIVTGAILGGVITLVIVNNRKTLTHDANVGPRKDYYFYMEDKADGDVTYDLVVDGEGNNNLPDKSKGNPLLKVTQYKTLMPDEQTFDYYLKDEDVKKLVERFLKNGNYGPEIKNLKSIFINNVYMTGNEENGIYFPESNEIGLNGTNFLKILKYAGNNAIENYDYRTELMYETLFHEYGHHLAYSYASSPFILNHNSTTVSKEIYQGDIGSRTVNNWNKAFLDNFKRILEYDGKVQTNLTKNFDLPISYTFSNASSLFAFSNRKDTSWSNFNNDGIGVYKMRTPYDNTANVQLSVSMSNKNVPYYFSMEELFTRKMLQASMAIDDNLSNMYQNGVYNISILQDEWNYETPYALFNKKAYTTEEQPKVGTRGRYLSDYVFDNVIQKDGSFPDPSNKRAVELAELVDKSMGQDMGSDISIIWPKNSWRIVDYSKIAVDSDDVSGEVNQIKFGGYIPVGNNYNYVGYKTTNKEGKTIFVGKEIEKNVFHLGYKDNLFSKSRNDVLGATGENEFYTTKNWIDANEIKDKQLYFAEDGNGLNATPLTTVRNFNGQNDEHDVASNYLELVQSNSTRNGSIYVANSQVYDPNDSSKNVVTIKYAGAWPEREVRNGANQNSLYHQCAGL